MSEGQLRCAGSPLFLKKTYGVGYQLTVEKVSEDLGLHVTNGKMIEEQPMDTDTDGEVFADSVAGSIGYASSDGGDDLLVTKPRLTSDELFTGVKDTISDAKLLSDVGTEMKVQLPLGASSKFSSMFEVLDKAVDDGDIVSYGVSMTTLGKSCTVYRSRSNLRIRRGLFACRSRRCRAWKSQASCFLPSPFQQRL